VVEKRHSRLGIASVGIGVSLPTLLTLLIVIFAVSKSPYVFAGLGMFAFFAPFLHFVGLVIGVIGWTSKKTKNIYSIIGTILNLVLGIIGIVLSFTLISFLVWIIGNVPVH